MMAVESHKLSLRLAPSLGIAALCLVAPLAVFTVPATAEGDRQTPSPKADTEGRWRQAPETGAMGLTVEQRREIERLRSIGYVTGSVKTDRRGVTVHSKGEVFSGMNFYSSGHGPEAVLMDMHGKVLHRWRKSFEDVWPDATKDFRKDGAKWWRRVYLYGNGDLLAIFEGLGLIKLDKSSNLIWALKNGAHHDLEVMPDGDIYVLTREPRLVPWVHETKPTLEDYLTILDPDGKVKREISILEAFRRSPYKDYVFESINKTGDVAHTNTVHVLGGPSAGRIPAFRKGNVLTAMNALGVVAVLDLESEQLVWAHKQTAHGLHDPIFLDNGNLLLFENYRRKGQSLVVELLPADSRTVWGYQGSPEHPFFSRTCGTAQRLPNGNTLITESDGGRAFELTPEKKIVWEFYIPHRAGENGEYIATLAEMLRLPPDFPTGWLR